MAASASITSSTSGPVFQAGGLASGLDTNSIVQAEVAVATEPLTALQTQQSDVQTQVSTLGTLVSDLQALQSATDGLSTNGALGLKTTSSNTTFTATPGTGAVAGSYAVQVTALAQAAKARSQGFAAGALVQGGTLTLDVQGTDYPITIADGSQLGDVAAAINQSGAPVSAVVLNDGTNSYLSLSDTNTGYPLTGTPADALSFTENYTGTTGQPLKLASTQTAANATLTVDGLSFTRQSNVVSDVLPGTTLTLNSVAAKGSAPETLTLANDPTATQANLQAFVSAYNTLVTALGQQLLPAAGTDRNSTLADDPAIRYLQSQLQQITTTVVPGIGGLNSLAQLGISTNEDGTLTIDSSTLASAISQNASAVNAIFASASTGISSVVDNLVTTYAEPGDGILSTDQAAGNQQIKDLQLQESDLQAEIATYQQTLQNQFNAMESTISSLKTSANYITALFSSSSTSSSSG
ncbi:MAG TPA: flagellar filament capping protein FliD [Anaeromyxobacteraceae bacterium]|nr:flagellar filament capping protein FliD [Anaeromyxobacteraceae bacterium]